MRAPRVSVVLPLRAGSAVEPALASLRAQTFGKLPKPKRVLPPLYTVEPVQDGERSITLRRTGDTPLVAALYHVPQGSHPDATAVPLNEGQWLLLIAGLALGVRQLRRRYQPQVG